MVKMGMLRNAKRLDLVEYIENARVRRKQCKSLKEKEMGGRRS